MSDGVHIEIEPEKRGPSGGRICRVRTDAQHEGRRATFSIVRKVEVRDRRPVNKEEVLFTRDFQALAGRTEIFELPGPDAELYEYTGPYMDIQIRIRVVIDDGFIWDTTAERAFPSTPFPNPRAGGCADHLTDPEDRYDFFKNLHSLPPTQRLMAGVVAVVGWGGLAANGFVVLHDMIVPRREQWLYPPDAGATFFIGLFGTIFGALLVHFLMNHLLGTYMSVAVEEPRYPIGRKETVRVADLISARALTALDNLTVRVIACNQEKGQYRRGSGTNTRTVSFSEATRGVVLFSKLLSYVPRGADLGSYLQETLDLTPMFDGLYPKQMVGSSHGMDVHFEIQLMHEDLVDRSVTIPGECFRWEAFLEDSGAESPGL